ncbi:hypothetical protein MTY66_57540 [Mycolicibacterium sp. TY66]|nr:hypothetical protein MTY66_57540 [Mycolicibacterium sp. TY66]
MSCWPPFAPVTAFLGLHDGHVTARDYYEASAPTLKCGSLTPNPSRHTRPDWLPETK